MDDDQAPPEVTISPADNGHVVRWHQRSSKKGESGRSITRVASSKEEALGHADEALGGGGSTKSSKRRSTRNGQSGAGLGSDAEGESGSASSPAAHNFGGSTRSRSRRRRPRVGSRRA